MLCSAHGTGGRAYEVLASIVVIALALAGAVWFGLPPLVKGLGLHPDYVGPTVDFPGGRALIVTTSQATLAPGSAATGVFASEMTGPYYVFLEGGMQVDVASIKGGAIPIDPLSFWWFVGRHPTSGSRSIRNFAARRKAR